VTALTWDKPGERIFQTGVDRGVLYLHDGRVIPWNGLTGVEESPQQELKSFWLDGVKYLDNLSPADFSGKLKAFTYPDEFDEVNGIVQAAPGLSYYEQPSHSFDLSYRTRIGDDIEGIEHGYKIHVLYNVIAVPDSTSFETMKGSDVSPVEFAWTLSGTPEKIHKLRPTVHISMDSTKTPPEIWQLLENLLYGTATTDPVLPTIDNIGALYGFLGALIIIDHGDGSWSALDQSDDYITMLDPTTFQIDNADATYLDAVTYTISTTEAG
jgi:hypothetical protein